MQANAKDLGAGSFFVFIGLLYGSLTWFGLPIGTALNMGPGYFPGVLSGILIVLGLAIAGRSFVDRKDRLPFGLVPWRAVALLSLSTIIFAAFVEKLGLMPGIFITALLASLASPQVRVLNAVISSACIALFCTAVFAYGIGLPLPVIGEWLQF